MSRLLLDTHALFWFVANDGALSASARTLIEEADEVFVSVATAWEAASKATMIRGDVCTSPAGERRQSSGARVEQAWLEQPVADELRRR